MSTKHAIIIGVGPGLGLALVNRFAREGFRVSLLARSQERLATYQQELTQQGFEVATFATDAGQPDSLAASLRQAQERFGPSQVLIYNAAVLREGGIMDYELADFGPDFQVNVLGALQAARQVAPAMIEAGQGTILLTGGGLAHAPYAGYASLTLGKAGILSVAQMLSQALNPQGIHVATITISGSIQPDTHFSPDKIADTFWQVYQAGDLKTVETPYD